MNEAVIILASAFALDIAAGDPRWIPHPVRMMGRTVRMIEPRARKMIGNEKAAGIVFALAVTGLWGLLSWGAVMSLRSLNAYAGLLVSVILGYTAISVRDLKDKTAKVHDALCAGDLPGARKSLAMVVGRDTGFLGQAQIARAAVETIAESTNDGIVAPIFYLAAGGPVLAIVYKAVSTLDSMVGYRNERYRDFGWFSAKLDDVFNYIPARLTGLLVSAVSFFSARPLSSFATMMRDGRKHPSPNSGISEAAFAGALGVRLGGPSSYGGVVCDKPYLGDGEADIGAGYIRSALRLSYRVAFLASAGGVLLRLIVT
ncbi:MAG: cobalamin biosynthesis protein CobD [Elusimicrobia bacterium]|nr:cobalamin biosynthesis protein CobD [Elusimicrobiota bacterium]